MNSQTLDILDYEGALKELAELTHSEPGRAAALSLRPFDRSEAILASWARIEEARALLATAESPEFRDLSDLGPLLKALGPEGAVLEPLELLAVAKVAAASRAALEFFGRQKTVAPLLAALAEELSPFKPLREDLERSVGPDGDVLDSASPALARIRQDLASSKVALAQRLAELIRSPEFKPFVMDDIVTTRGDRFVVPVRAGAAGRSRGLVHDWSNSGATAYLEPLEAVEDNNRLAYLKNREKEEIFRILSKLSSQCRAEALNLSASAAALTRLDLIMAQGRLAQSWRAATPEHKPGLGFNLKDLRHPLLEKRLAQEGRRLVPLDLVATPEAPLLVISGLNAGGKTVALKTLGLALALAATGLPIPAAEGSWLDFPADVLAVMGDNQDLAA
ncbi:MAG: hypothetical protein LBE01_03275, partial [Deltaproteobacteria bacterium]|nr:hypothetical protein [Deltaproteobacteria bacterium]